MLDEHQIKQIAEEFDAAAGDYCALDMSEGPSYSCNDHDMDTAQIIICGHDPALLAMRKQILTRAGMTVATTENVADLRGRKAKLLVLCYTLSDSEQLQGLEAVRAETPDAPVLLLDRDTPLLTSQPYEMMSSLEGPTEFCRRVTELTRSAA